MQPRFFSVPPDILIHQYFLSFVCLECGVRFRNASSDLIINQNKVMKNFKKHINSRNNLS